MIDHSTRLRQKSLAIENKLKYQLANSPNFKSNLKLYSEIKKKLINLQIKKHKKLIKNDELFQYSHNLATKEFFRQFIQKRENVMIRESVDEYGLPRTSPGELVEHVQRCYTRLYGCDQNDTTKQTVFLDNINAKLSDQQNSYLQLELSEREIETAISQIAKGKAPGPDGLSIEFYTHCWPIVKDEVVSMLREMFSTQTNWQISINWQNDSIKILGLKIGRLNSKTIWKDVLENLRAQKLSINIPLQTWQTKSLLAKAKLLPQLTYTAHTYSIDTATQRVIETEFLNYLTNNTTIQLCMRNLQRPTISGGIKYPNPIIYSNLFYISNLFEYFKIRKNDLPFNSNTYLIEYEIGLVLSQTYNLPILNHIPHRDYPTPCYQKTLQILKEYKITLEELNKYTIEYPILTNVFPTRKPSVGN